MAKKVTKVAAKAVQEKVGGKPTITTMTCSKLFSPIAPYSPGKMITMPGVGTWGYSSG